MINADGREKKTPKTSLSKAPVCLKPTGFRWGPGETRRLKRTSKYIRCAAVGENRRARRRRGRNKRIYL